jgi:thiamine pyrophosphokinase
VQEPDPAAGLPLRFDGFVVAVGGGPVDAELLQRLAGAGGHLVGADGGGDVIAAAGLRPIAIIGDLDSLADPSAWDARTRIIRLEEQETTDFEKLLYSTTAPLTVALGMTGNRLDHTLAALDVVTRHARNRNIVLVDETDLALAVTGPFAFEVKPGERVSVHPLGLVAFSHSEGLRHPLDGLTLAPGLRTGTSNASITGSFSITPQPDQAPWLLILGRHHLPRIIAAALKRDASGS